MKRFLTALLITTMALTTPVSAHTSDLHHSTKYDCSVHAHAYVRMPGYFTQDIIVKGKKMQRKYVVKHCQICDFEKYDLQKRAVKGGF